jgi:hypothetical protein
MVQSYRPAAMRGLSFEPFSDRYLDAAAELLAARHARQRGARPLLSARFENPSEARAEVEALWQVDDTPGVVAIADGRVVGYLIGVRRSDEVWGPNVWIEAAGHAVEEAEVGRDLYGAVAGEWVEAGRTRHYAMLPASDEPLVEAWFRLGFGQQHALGIRAPEDGAGASPPAVIVRDAEESDVDALVGLAPALAEHQLGSPVFSGRPPSDTDEEIRAEIVKDLADSSIGNLVAEVDGAVVGNFVVVPVEHSAMHVSLARPDGAAFLAWAATLPATRGSGTGLALADAGFVHAGCASGLPL